MTQLTPPPPAALRPPMPTISGSALMESRLLLATVRHAVAAWLLRG